MMTSAEGKIHVIPQPGHQGHVPASPKIGNRRRMVGIVEIVRKIDPKDLCASDRDIHITGKIAINLESEKHRRYDKHHTLIIMRVVVNRIDQMRQAISDNHFFKQPQQDQPQAASNTLVVECNILPQLWQNVRAFRYRSSYKMREQRDKQGKQPKMFPRRLAPVDINDISGGLKREKRYPDREYQVVDG